MDIDPYSAPSAAAYIPQQPADSGTASPAAIEKLSATRPWVIFIAVMLFVGSGFMLLATFAMLAAGTMMSVGSKPGAPNVLGGGMIFVIAAIYLVLALVNILFGVRLCLYAGAISRLIRDGSETHLVQALDRQRSFWKLAGIATIVAIAGYILLMVGMVATSFMRLG